jgi:hypothetical protein
VIGRLVAVKWVRFMSESVFTRLAVAFALLAYCASVIPLSLGPWSVFFGVPFSIWTTSPVFWWFAWAMRRRGSADMRRAALSVGVVLAPAYAGFTALAWYAAHRSSTGGVALLTLPLLLLILTILVTSVVGACARRGEPAAIARSPYDDTQALARDLARVAGKRAERARRKGRMT